MTRGPTARFFAAASLAAMLVACLGAGIKNYKQGEKLRTEGKLLEARAEYKTALGAEPNSGKYREALDSLDSEIDERVADLVAEAKALKRQGDWAGASSKYATACQYRPDDSDLVAHRELSALKSKAPDKMAWFKGVRAINNKVPGNKIVSRALAGAQASAYQEQVERAEAFVITGQGKEAWGAYEGAKEIQETLPGIDLDKYNHAHALHLAEQAELRLAAGDAVAAYDIYQKALAKKDLPEIKKAMWKAKQAASKILKTLEQARAQATRGRWKQAIFYYDELKGMDGVPPEVEEEGAKARVEYVKANCGDAERNISSNSLSRAHRSVVEALKHAALSDDEKNALTAASEQASRGKPGDAAKVLKNSGVAEDDIVRKTVSLMAHKSAENVLRTVEAVARRDSKKALILLSSLSAFAKDIPKIKELRRALLKTSFSAMLDDALQQAKNGDDEEAAEVLLSALNASKAPKAMRDAAEAGCEALKAKNFVEAEKSFTAALAQAPRSKLAQRGVDIARFRRGEAEREALAKIRDGSGDIESAVATLEAARKSDGSNKTASEAAGVLIQRAKTSGDPDDLLLAATLGYAARLSDMPSGARIAIEEGKTALAKGEYGPAEDAFKKAESAAPGAAVTKAAREIANARLLVALKSGASKAGEGDEEGARRLGELLQKNPNDPDAKGALQAILDRADAAAKANDDEGTASYLMLATVATRPEPGLADALEKGYKALGEGNMAEAEKNYSDATDLEAEQPVAKLGLAIAQRNRVAGLDRAVAVAITGKDYELVKAALRRAMELDPNAKEVSGTYEKLVNAAVDAGRSGNDQAAASLLDAANVVSRPESARSKVEAANALLAQGKHEEAVKAYGQLLNATKSMATAGQSIAEDRIRQILLAGVAKLQDGTDLDRGAKSTAELLAREATNEVAHAAIKAAVLRAEDKAEAKDMKGAVVELRAAGIAAKAGADFDRAVLMLESGKSEESAAAFDKLDGDMAKRAAAIARGQRMAGLREGMANADAEKKAKSIATVLAEDPTNAEAQAALRQLLDEAKTAGKKGDDKGAASAIEAALIASGAPDDLGGIVKIGTSHLRGERYAEAEKAFETGLELAGDSQVVQTGHQVSKDRRVWSQRTALKKIESGDPTDAAKVLAASLLVEPESNAVKQAFKKLLVRARSAAKSNKDAEAAKILDAAVLLEGLPSGTIKAVTEADALFAESKFSDAFTAYEAVNAEADSPKSEVGALGAELSNMRRLGSLRDDLAAADKNKDSLAASKLVAKILEIDPKDRGALKAQQKYAGLVVKQRIDQAKAQKDLGKLGAAHLYLRRALALDSKNAGAKQELDAIEDMLKKRTSFVVFVDKVARDSSVGAGWCKEIEGWLRSELIGQGAANEGLGLYVLPEEWTKAVDSGDPKAPKITGSLTAKLTKCQSGQSGGSASLEWSLHAPRDARVVASGEVDAEVPKGILPSDEQDSAGVNARKALARYAAKGIVGKLEEARTPISLWLMTVAEHWVEKKDAAEAADAFARQLVIAPTSYDPERAKPVEAFLDAEYE